MSDSQESREEVPSFLSLALYSLVAGMLMGIAALGAFLFYDQVLRQDDAQELPAGSSASAEYDGIVEISPPLAIDDLTLTSATGDSTSISDLRGRYTLLTFGFTHCPDICPLTLSEFERIRRQLGSEAEQIHFAFISVDGKRDTPSALSQYFAFRKLDFITALTGAEADVRAYGAPFGLAFAVSDEAIPGGYNVNHTTGAFLLDREGRWIRRYHFGVPVASIVADLRQLVAG